MTREEIETAARVGADAWLGQDARGTLGYAGLVIAIRETCIGQVNAALEETADVVLAVSVGCQEELDILRDAAHAVRSMKIK
jgi:hypothetical protein